jgi:hypothetical protein
MLQLILALLFIAMIVTPALVAAVSGKKEFEPEADENSRGNLAARRATQAAAPSETLRATQPARRERKAETATTRTQAFEAATLPMHGTLGMAGR